jgi:hypothetical protein
MAQIINVCTFLNLILGEEIEAFSKALSPKTASTVFFFGEAFSSCSKTSNEVANFCHHGGVHCAGLAETDYVLGLLVALRFFYYLSIFG